MKSGRLSTYKTYPKFVDLSFEVIASFAWPKEIKACKSAARIYCTPLMTIHCFFYHKHILLNTDVKHIVHNPWKHIAHTVKKCAYLLAKNVNEVKCTFLDWTWSRLSAAAEDLNGDIFWRKFMHVYIVCVHV